jgi:soluble lytic murein transglycosylase
MSSMLRACLFTALASAATLSVPACAEPDTSSANLTQAEEARAWDVARGRSMQGHELDAHRSVERWSQLVATDRLPFETYSGFLLTYPGYPQAEKLQASAEKALMREPTTPSAVAAFFDRYPPLSNAARGRYALALNALARGEAAQQAKQAWRGGNLDPADEAAISSLYGRRFSPADHDARMDALLWQAEADQGARQMAFVSPERRDLFMERLSLAQGAQPNSLAVTIPPTAMGDPGYVYNRAVQARRSGDMTSAIRMLANRPLLRDTVPEPEKWVRELLTAARAATADSAVRIAASIDDAFEPGADISQMSYRLRDDYTSLVWLGGTRALWDLNRPATAAPLFYRYGAAAQTPGTRSKGFYWAGKAAAMGGDEAGARRYFEMAAQYPHYFYGQLSLERLGRPLPDLDLRSSAIPTATERADFNARPITAAARDVARDGDWRTTIQFFREISDQAGSEADHVLVQELARETGRRDLAVILGQSAHADGYHDFGKIAFPTIPIPAGANWLMDHALIRQESQFAENAISHAGARGLMQLMPGTAREQAGKMGLSYDSAALITDPSYNIRLGDGYFARMMDYFGGSFPLAVAAYNAGPGNVNKWLRANGDPRNGTLDWLAWIEQIPIYETKNYVQRVLENAVVYDRMYPGHFYYSGNAPLSNLIGKKTPG